MPNVAYGCVFCITGKENIVAECIEKTCPGVRATAARQMKHKSVNGKKSRQEAVIMPGYVFFEAESSFEPKLEFPSENIIRVLTTEKNQWRLIGGDRQFVDWLLSYNGLLDFSTAYKEGEHVHILSGPLKDMEGHITKVDKRGRSGQVELTFNGHSMKVWLGFDLIDPMAKGMLNMPK